MWLFHCLIFLWDVSFLPFAAVQIRIVLNTTVCVTATMCGSAMLQLFKRKPYKVSAYTSVLCMFDRQTDDWVSEWVSEWNETSVPLCDIGQLHHLLFNEAPYVPQTRCYWLVLSAFLNHTLYCLQVIMVPCGGSGSEHDGEIPSSTSSLLPLLFFPWTQSTEHLLSFSLVKYWSPRGTKAESKEKKFHFSSLDSYLWTPLPFSGLVNLSSSG